jgi:hypothetical protein
LAYFPVQYLCSLKLLSKLPLGRKFSPQHFTQPQFCSPVCTIQSQELTNRFGTIGLNLDIADICIDPFWITNSELGHSHDIQGTATELNGAEMETAAGRAGDGEEFKLKPSCHCYADAIYVAGKSFSGLLLIHPSAFPL